MGGDATCDQEVLGDFWKIVLRCIDHLPTQRTRGGLSLTALLRNYSIHSVGKPSLLTNYLSVHS
jgi:hypothetical protein